MKFRTALLCAAFGVAPFSFASAQVAIGDSSLISNLQYSDSFTIGDGAVGTRNGNSYTAGTYPLSTSDAVVENSHGNASQSWQTTGFSMTNDANAVVGFNPYPGGSGAGSATGITQTGVNPGTVSFGFGYGLSSDFIVQTDITGQLSNTGFVLNIGSTNSGAANSAADGLSLVFNQSGTIDLYNAVLGTASTGLNFSVTQPWNNYAAEFNLVTKTLSIYSNQTLVGTLNLNTFSNGVTAYGTVLDANSNAFVGVGETNSTGGFKVFWTDNFQVGTNAVPEPSTWAMLVSGLAFLGVVIRRKGASKI